jgi:hypothetical protein
MKGAPKKKAAARKSSRSKKVVSLKAYKRKSMRSGAKRMRRAA